MRKLNSRYPFNNYKGGLRSLGFELSWQHLSNTESILMVTHRQTGETLSARGNGTEQMKILLNRLAKRNHKRLREAGLKEYEKLFDRGDYTLSISEAGLAVFRHYPEDWASVPIDRSPETAAEALAAKIRLLDLIIEAEKTPEEKEMEYQEYVRSLEPFSRSVLYRLEYLGVTAVTVNSLTRGNPRLSVTLDQAGELMLDGWDRICHTKGILCMSYARSYFWWMGTHVRILGREEFLARRELLNSYWLDELEWGNVPEM